MKASQLKPGAKAVAVGGRPLTILKIEMVNELLPQLNRYTVQYEDGAKDKISNYPAYLIQGHPSAQ